MKNNTIIIAEIGINHDGSLEMAKLLVKEALDSGCDQIKFQYRRPSNSTFQLELGSEIVQSEINRVYIAPPEIMKLAEMIKDSKRKVGISFFSLSDAYDFQEQFHYFDFFKIPSASNKNEELIKYLSGQNKPVYLSLGMLEHYEVVQLASLYSKNLNVIPFHCVSNYPTKVFNSNLNYINSLRDLWDRPIGYSSHDDNLLVLAKAIDLGVEFLERHIALDRRESGLDKSSSSTPEEFRMLREFIDFYELIQRPMSNRIPNQGEKLNRQNLGYSLYSLRDFESGMPVTLDDFVERSPAVGLTTNEFKSLSTHVLKGSLNMDEPVSRLHFQDIQNLNKELQLIAQQKLISVPVRYHDIHLAEQTLGLNAYEFHLSYNDLKLDVDIENLINPNYFYSIHTPDYISSTQILDIHSVDSQIANESQKTLDRCISMSLQIAELTGKSVPVIASINTNSEKQNFYEKLKDLQLWAETREVDFLPQWLPPIAWYFGGSVPLKFMNSPEAISKIQQMDIKICLDFSHLILSCNFFNLDLRKTYEILAPYSSHHHLASADGIDSEGTSLRNCTPEQQQIVQEIVDSNCVKVLEVWQGHLNRFAGFIPEIQYIDKLN